MNIKHELEEMVVDNLIRQSVRKSELRLSSPPTQQQILQVVVDDDDGDDDFSSFNTPTTTTTAMSSSSPVDDSTPYSTPLNEIKNDNNIFFPEGTIDTSLSPPTSLPTRRSIIDELLKGIDDGMDNLVRSSIRNSMTPKKKEKNEEKEQPPVNNNNNKKMVKTVSFQDDFVDALSDENKDRTVATTTTTTQIRIEELLKDIDDGMDNLVRTSIQKSVLTKNEQQQQQQQQPVVQIELNDVATTTESSEDTIWNIILLLIDCETKEFEFLQLELSKDNSRNTTVDMILQQIPMATMHSKITSFQHTNYSYICDADLVLHDRSISLDTFCNNNDVLVALPESVDTNEWNDATFYRQHIMPIFTEYNVHNLMRDNGAGESANKWSKVQQKSTIHEDVRRLI